MVRLLEAKSEAASCQRNPQNQRTTISKQLVGKQMEKKTPEQKELEHQLEQMRKLMDLTIKHEQQRGRVASSNPDKNS